MPARPRLNPWAAIALTLLFAPTAALAAGWPHGIGDAIQVAPSLNGQDVYNTKGTLPDGVGGMFIAFSMWNGSAFNVYVQRLTSSGAVSPGWPSAGLAVAPTSTPESAPTAVTDGAGGVIVVWYDRRRGSISDLYAQRVTASGTIPGGWPATGAGMATEPNDKISFSACADGAGGAFVAYTYGYSGSDYDIYVSHVSSAGSVIGIPVDTQGSYQMLPAVAADGVGGCYIAYEDNAGGNFDIRVTRKNSSLSTIFTPVYACQYSGDQRGSQMVVDAAGRAVIMWVDSSLPDRRVSYQRVEPNGTRDYFSSGVPLTVATGDQQLSLLVPDEAGGFYVTWLDARLSAPGFYMQHYSTQFALYPGWPATGMMLTSAPNGTYPGEIDMTTDGSNGAIAVWRNLVPGGAGLYGTHLDAFGALEPLVAAGGMLVSFNGDFTTTALVASDKLGGAFFTWLDNHTGVGQVWAQHVDPFMTLGDARPVSAGVRDLLADQGGRVRLTWNASWLDNPQNRGIGAYWVWRQAPLSAAQQAVSRGGAWADAGLGAAVDLGGGRQTFRHAADKATGYAWEFLAQQPANYSAQYSYVSATTTDSIVGHNPYTVFMIEAHAAADSRAFWQSAADSGYSVDNLPPATPAPFLGAYTTGVTHLHWDRNTEADLAGYRLYRGGSPSFVPALGNRIAAPPDTGYGDPGPAGSFYKLSAVDVHGNESGFALLGPAGTTTVPGDALPTQLAFERPRPDPAARLANLSFALPRDGRVALAVWDAAGRRVRTLVNGEQPAGVHTLSWDLRDDGGRRLSAGLYFMRLEYEGRALTRRLVALP